MGANPLRATDDLAWYTDHSCAGWHFFNHNRVGANARTVANEKTTQYFSTSTNHHTFTQARVSFAMLQACASQRYPLVQSAVIADLCGLTNNHAHAMINKHAPADFGPRMDLNPRKKTTPSG